MDTKSCYNCKHFIRHWVVYNYIIRPLDCGHCLKRRKKIREKESFPFKDGCNKWEQLVDNIDENKELLKRKLKRLARELHDIALILREEDGNNQSGGCI